MSSSPTTQPTSDLPAPDTAPVSVAATAPGGAQHFGRPKFTRSQPGTREQARRQAWGRRQGALNRDAIRQAMEAMG